MRRTAVAALTAALLAGCASEKNAESIVREACGERTVPEFRKRTKGEGIARRINVAQQMARACQDGR